MFFSAKHWWLIPQYCGYISMMWFPHGRREKVGSWTLLTWGSKEKCLKIGCGLLLFFSSSHGSTWEKNRKDSRFSNDYCRFSEGNPRPWTLSMRRNNDPDKLQKKETARKRAPWLAMAVVSGFGPPGFWLGIIGKMSSSGPVMRLSRFCDTLIFKFSQSSFRQKSGTWLGMTNGLCLASAQMWCTSLPISTYISRNGCTGALTVQQACLQQICDTYTLYLEPLSYTRQWDVANPHKLNHVNSLNKSEVFFIESCPKVFNVKT